MKASACFTRYLASLLSVAAMVFTAPTMAASQLVKETVVDSVNTVRATPTLSTGTGSYVVKGGEGREEKQITVHYHKPENFSADSSVLIVLAGAGRNADSYLKPWVKAAEKHSVLVLSLEYSEQHYPMFWHYNIGGMIDEVTFNKARTSIASYQVVKNPTDWIFDDFDRIFDQATGSLKMTTQVYDMFGHSAGGQVLHRYVMFNRSHKVNRLLAANSGWYTVPVFDQAFPMGLKGAVMTKDNLKAAFKAKLVLFIGELDNEHETRGKLASSPEIDVQGNSRVARADYFFKHAKSTANKLNAELNWQLTTVPNVGHNKTKMTTAAINFLYETRR